MIKCDSGNVSLNGVDIILYSEFVMIARAMYETCAEEIGKDKAKKKLEYYFSLAFKSTEEVKEMIADAINKNINEAFKRMMQQEKERED